jgi:DNA-binding NarL/FixJ family response regulator
MPPIRVLLVDDRADFLNAAADLLAHDPRIHVVGRAGNGEQGVHLVSLLAPDLVLMDMSMPVMNGLVATRRIKTMTRPPMVVLVSLHDSLEDRQRAAHAGADGFVVKSRFVEDIPTVIAAAVLRCGRIPGAP